MLNMLRTAKQVQDHSIAVDDLYLLANVVAISKGKSEARQLAEQIDAPRRVQEIIKASVAAGTTSGVGVTLDGPILGALLQQSRNNGAFDTIAQSATRMPFMQGRARIFTSVAASTVAEGAAKTLKSVNLSEVTINPVKVIAQCVLTRELVLALTQEGMTLLGRELSQSVATGSDAAFLTALAGNSSDASGSATWAGVLADLGELTRMVKMGANSRPFFVMSSAMCKEISQLAFENGIDTLGATGGSILGIEVLISDAWPVDTVSLIDSTGLAVAMGPISLRSSEEAVVEMVDSSSQTSGPSVSAVQAVSLFQTDSVALLAERVFAVKPVRVASWAHMTNVLAAQFDSPLVT